MAEVVLDMNNLMKRVLSALVLVIMTFIVFYLGSPYLDIYVVLFCLTLIGEWAWLCFKNSHADVNRLNYFIFGVIYILFASFGFWKTLGTHDDQMLFLGLLLLVWSSDIGAYFAGKIFGGPKLAPQISPGKTVSGAIGGLISALVVPLSISLFMPIRLWHVGALIGVAILAQMGDLLESWVKRRLNVKDSSGLLPGHGGLLDRLDSILPIGVVLAILHYFYT